MHPAISRLRKPLSLIVIHQVLTNKWEVCGVPTKNWRIKFHIFVFKDEFDVQRCFLWPSFMFWGRWASLVADQFLVKMLEGVATGSHIFQIRWTPWTSDEHVMFNKSLKMSTNKNLDVTSPFSDGFFGWSPSKIRWFFRCQKTCSEMPRLGLNTANLSELSDRWAGYRPVVVVGYRLEWQFCFGHLRTSLTPKTCSEKDTVGGYRTDGYVIRFDSLDWICENSPTDF